MLPHTGNSMTEFPVTYKVCFECLGLKRVYLPTVKSFADYIRKTMFKKKMVLEQRKEWHKTKSIVCPECNGDGVLEFWGEHAR